MSILFPIPDLLSFTASLGLYILLCSPFKIWATQQRSNFLVLICALFSGPVIVFGRVDSQNILVYEYAPLLFTCLVRSDFLPPHGLSHARHPYPLQSPSVCSTSCPLIQWFHPTISSSIIPFSSCPLSFPISGSFPMSCLFTSGGQSTGALPSVLPVNSQGWFPLGLTGLTSSLSKGLSWVFSSNTVQKHLCSNS